MVFAYTLETTPVPMLAHIPLGMPDPEVPLATAIPSGIEKLEPIEWMTGRSTLVRAARTSWEGPQRTPGGMSSSPR